MIVNEISVLMSVKNLKFSHVVLILQKLKLDIVPDDVLWTVEEKELYFRKNIVKQKLAYEIGICWTCDERL